MKKVNVQREITEEQKEFLNSLNIKREEVIKVLQPTSSDLVVYFTDGHKASFKVYKNISKK